MATPSVARIAFPSDQAAWYRGFFHAALDDGVYLPPSPYEVCFLSLAHDDLTLALAADALVEAALRPEARCRRPAENSRLAYVMAAVLAGRDRIARVVVAVARSVLVASAPAPRCSCGRALRSSSCWSRAALAILLAIRREHRRRQALETFFMSFTHDLKTSLASVQLQAEGLREDWPEGAAAHVARPPAPRHGAAADSARELAVRRAT